MFRTVYYALGYQVITDTWAVQQSLLLKRCGVETSAWCLASGVPCGWSSFQLGLHLSSSFSSHPSPSCGTCGGGRSPIRCSEMMAGRLEGHSSPGNWQQEPCCPFWGWPWKSLHGCYRLHHCWACRLRLRWTFRRRARGAPSCGCVMPRKIRRPASDTSHIRSWHCSVIEVQQVILPPPPHKHRRGRMRASLTCRRDRLGGVVGMRQCAAPSAWRWLLLSQHYAQGSCRVSRWHGPILAHL